MGVLVILGVVVGAAIRGDWSIVLGAFMGFGAGGLFYERMQHRRGLKISLGLLPDRRRKRKPWLDDDGGGA